MIEIIACLTLLQVFHQCLPCDTDTSWCTGGTGGVLQVNQTVFCGIYNDIFPFVRCQTVSIDAFQPDDTGKCLPDQSAGKAHTGFLFQCIIGDQCFRLAGF